MDVIRTVAIFGLFSISGAAISGTIIEVERFNDDGERDSTITIALQDGKLRMDQIDEEEQRSALIYDGNRVIDVNISEHTYAVVERSKLAKAKQTLDPQATLREELLAEVPSQRRGDAMLALNAPPGWTASKQKLTVQPTSRTSRVGNLSCRIYQVLASKQVKFEYCMFADTQRTDLNAFMDAGEHASDLISEFFGTLGMPWMQQTMQFYWTHAYDMEGFPLRVSEFESGARMEDFRLRSIQEKSVAAEEFAIPKDYRRRAVLDFGAPSEF
jgi:hypothetical protein